MPGGGQSRVPGKYNIRFKKKKILKKKLRGSREEEWFPNVPLLEGVPPGEAEGKEGPGKGRRNSTFIAPGDQGTKTEKKLGKRRGDPF